MTELETPIKIDWTGDARQKFRGRKVDARINDGGPHGEETAATLDRYKTIVSVETEEEAEALEAMLEGMVDAGYSWQTENHTKAFRRVLKELREGMDELETSDAEGSDETTIDFETDEDEGQQPDVYVEDTFVNKYDDKRAELAGDTYSAMVEDDLKEILDWEVTHHKFNKPTKTWLIDFDALDYFKGAIEELGYTFSASVDDDAEGSDDALTQLHDGVEEGDRITVEYWQKNGEGDNSKAGMVTSIEDGPEVNFVRDDDQWMSVRYDKFWKPALFTGGSTSPFVGTVKAVTVDRDIDTTEDTDASEESADDTPEPADDDSETAEALKRERLMNKLFEKAVNGDDE